MPFIYQKDIPTDKLWKLLNGGAYGVNYGVDGGFSWLMERAFIAGYLDEAEEMSATAEEIQYLTALNDELKQCVSKFFMIVTESDKNNITL